MPIQAKLLWLRNGACAGKAVDIAARTRLRPGMAGLRQLIGGSLAASVPPPTGHLTVIHRDGRGPCVR